MNRKLLDALPRIDALQRPKLVAIAAAAPAVALASLAEPIWLALYTALLLVVVLTLALQARCYAQLAADHHELAALPLAIAHDAAMLDLFRAIGVALRDMAANLDPIYRELALDRARQASQELTAAAGGRIAFEGTEAWRRAYEQLLRSRGLYRYRSVAYVRTSAYWQDEPGRQSMRVNFEMQASGLQIERIVIVADSLWPTGELVPVEPIDGWIDGQVRQGIQVKLVRASRIEADLRDDFGLYGNRAVGHQQVDDQGRTVRFALSFDFAELLAAEARWDRLSIYATSYENLLDRSEECT